MPLTSASDDSEYVTELTDAMFLRELADRFGMEMPSEDAERLEKIAGDLELVQGLVTTDVPAHDTVSWNDLLSPEYDWNPGEEEEARWLNLFLAERNRDLVAEVRNDLKNPLDDGVNMLDEIPNDQELAMDLKDKVEGYENVDLRLMTFAVREVRRKGIVL